MPFDRDAVLLLLVHAGRIQQARHAKVADFHSVVPSRARHLARAGRKGDQTIQDNFGLRVTECHRVSTHQKVAGCHVSVHNVLAL